VGGAALLLYGRVNEGPAGTWPSDECPHRGRRIPTGRRGEFCDSPALATRKILALAVACPICVAAGRTACAVLPRQPSDYSPKDPAQAADNLCGQAHLIFSFGGRVLSRPSPSYFSASSQLHRRQRRPVLLPPVLQPLGPPAGRARMPASIAGMPNLGLLRLGRKCIAALATAVE